MLCLITSWRSESPIDQVMRECISDSDDKHLDRLRSGALWVNRMVASLAPTLRHRASEIFVLCEHQRSRVSALITLANFQRAVSRSIAQYGCSVEVGPDEPSYFVEGVSASAPGPEIHASLAFVMLFLVKMVVGEIYG